MLRLIERYNSFQGEGPNTGAPTMFVRFAGCNFKCPGWPCDTQHAIDPKIFGKRQQLVSWEDLADRILSEHSITNICITGGEPFLQNHEELVHMCSRVREQGRTIEVFTNGSILWPENIGPINNFIVDWKLPGSGEFPDEGILLANLARCGAADAIKFTVKDRDDYDRAVLNYRTYIEPCDPLNRPVVWCGPVWGCITSEKVSRWIQTDRLPWYLNTQVHKYVYGADTEGV